MRFDLWRTERESADVLSNGLRVLRRDMPKPVVSIWNPKAEKPAAHYSFRSPEAREAYVEKYVANYDESQRTKVERRGARSTVAKQHASTIDVGHIFRYSWGYDQTNIQYFQVVEKHGMNLTLCEIGQSVVPGSEGFMCENVEPRIGHFLSDNNSNGSPRTNGGKAFTKRLQFTPDGRAYLAFEYGWCDLWRGGSSYQSHYA